MGHRLVRLARMGIVVAAVALAIASFLAVDAGSHSASDTLRPWLIQVAVILVLAGVAWAGVGRLRAGPPEAR